MGQGIEPNTESNNSDNESLILILEHLNTQIKLSIHKYAWPRYRTKPGESLLQICMLSVGTTDYCPSWFS